MPDAERTEGQVLTIGHSNHPIERFLELLRLHSVTTVADVRSYPYCNYASQFDREVLVKSLRQAGVGYVYLGGELGGRPRGEEFYDAEGRVLYEKVAGSAPFLNGLARLERGIRRHRVALLCSEENPAGCHRRLLVGRVLAGHAVSVCHIRGDGSLETEAELQAAEPRDCQLSLFEESRNPEWKSIPLVSHRKRQSSSSAF